MNQHGEPELLPFIFARRKDGSPAFLPPTSGSPKDFRVVVGTDPSLTPKPSMSGKILPIDRMGQDTSIQVFGAEGGTPVTKSPSHKKTKAFEEDDVVLIAEVLLCASLEFRVEALSLLTDIERAKVLALIAPAHGLQMLNQAWQFGSMLLSAAAEALDFEDDSFEQADYLSWDSEEEQRKVQKLVDFFRHINGANRTS
eukprot:1669261-Rhodomonas_salina.1